MDKLTHDSSVLYKPFDFNEHLKAFGDTYLEAVVLEDGTIEYAIPSHEQKLVRVIMQKTGKTRDQVIWDCSDDDKLNWQEYLERESGCISLWTNFYLGTANEKQLEAIQKLKDHKIVHDDYAQYR